MRTPMPPPLHDLPAVSIWTDGSCLGNPGPGGWAAVLVRDLRAGQRRRELSGGDTATTNNRMEITAAIEALAFLKRPYRVRLHTDSELIVKTMTVWLPSRLGNGWSSVANADLWRELYDCMTWNGCTSAPMPETSTTNAAMNWRKPPPWRRGAA